MTSQTLKQQDITPRLSRHEYRITRPDSYPVGTPPESMEGYYVSADSADGNEENTREQVLLAFRDARSGQKDERLDAVLFKINGVRVTPPRAQTPTLAPPAAPRFVGVNGRGAYVYALPGKGGLWAYTLGDVRDPDAFFLTEHEAEIAALRTLADPMCPMWIERVARKVTP